MMICNSYGNPARDYVLEIVERAYRAGHTITLSVVNKIKVNDVVRQTLQLEIDGYLDLPEIDLKEKAK